MADLYTQVQDMKSYWDIPGMRAGVVTGKVAFELLKYCKAKDLALPALSNCTGSRSCNVMLEEAAKLGMPAYIQFSVGGASLFAGKSLANDKGKYQAAILGACAGAHYVRYVAPAYGIPVIVQSDHCTKEFLPWFEGMLEADEVCYKEHGQPLFTSHKLDLSEEPHEENVRTCRGYFARLVMLDLILEIRRTGSFATVRTSSSSATEDSRICPMLITTITEEQGLATMD
jgi:fructose-bisphosphate aldolase class II